MSNNTNSVQIIGKVGKAPEVKPEVGNGLATFSLAHNRYVPGQEKPVTSWFRCVAWGKMAEVVGRLEKGQRVLVSGRLESRTWKNGAGQVQSGIEIVVDNVQIISTIPASSDPSSKASTPNQATQEQEAVIEAEGVVEAQEAASPKAKTAGKPKATRSREATA